MWEENIILDLSILKYAFATDMDQIMKFVKERV